MSHRTDRLPEADDVRLMLFCERAETLDDSPWEESFGGAARTVTWRSHRPYSLINISPYVEMTIPGDLVGCVSLWLNGGVNYRGVGLLLVDESGAPTGQVLPMPDPPDLRDSQSGQGDHRIWRMEGCFTVPAPGRYLLVLANMSGSEVIDPAIVGTNLEIRAI